MIEYWKVIKGFKTRFGGYYWVSSLGRFKNDKGRILKFHPHKKGYLMVQLPKEGYARGARWQAHRLVAIAFIPNPDQLPQVNHVDGNKKNNAISNLQWCTNLENMIHARKSGLFPKQQRGGESPYAHLTNEQAIEIRNAKLTKGPTNGLSRSALAKIYGVSEHVIKDIRAGRRYQEC